MSSQNLAFTREECRKWFKEKTRNPRTNRPIRQDTKRNGMYNELEKQCEKFKEASPPKIVTRRVVRRRKPPPETNGEQTRGVPEYEVTPRTQDAYDKYCRCLMRTRVSIKGKPYEKAVYAICNKTVLKSRDMSTRPEYCEYNFNDFDTEQLLAYAEELEGRQKWDWKMSNSSRSGNKDALVEDLRALQKRMKAAPRRRAQRD